MPDLMDKIISGELTAEDLSSTHELYDKYYDEWRFLNAAYEGVRALLAWGVIKRHERESETNYDRRIDEAYGFSYSRSIVDIFNSYLFKKDYPRTIPMALANQEQWLAFMDDANLEQQDFDDFFVEQARQSSIQGHVGILVDMPKRAEGEIETKAEELSQGVYPYVAAYKPTYILDWQWERDAVTGRRVLTYLKLLDDDDYYRIWTRDYWQIWEIIQNTDTNVEKVDEYITSPGPKAEQLGMAAKMLDSGDNPLGEIPFVWLWNEHSTIDKEIGKSDINDISRIDGSIIRNMSQIEEIINYAAFPMMRKPQVAEGSTDTDDEVGVTAVLEFDPEMPESKPDWLSAEVSGPIQATLEVVAKKINEIYRSSNVGGMTATQEASPAKSGVALKVEFQMLNSKLVKKAKNVVRAKREVVDFWLKWVGLYESYNSEVEFSYIKTFEVEDLMADLENILTSGAIVTFSELFTKHMQKTAARLMIPPGEDELLADIDKEIDDWQPQLYDFGITTEQTTATGTAAETMTEEPQE